MTDHKRNRRQMKPDQDQSYDEAENHRVSENVVEVLKRPGMEKRVVPKFGTEGGKNGYYTEIIF